MFLFGMLLFGTIPVAWWIRPLLSDDKILCIFRLLTRHECPFCGLTRSFACAVHGELSKAFQYHPLWPIAAFLVLVVGTLCIYEAIYDANYFGYIKRMWNLPIWVFCIVLIILTILRSL
jgi:hypothetical protein